MSKTTTTIGRQGAQGDLLARRVAAVPDGYAPVERPMGGHVVAHSETGHHHVVREAPSAPPAVLYRPQDDTGPEQGMVAYLEVIEAHADLVHMRAYDTHGTLRLPVGIWEIRRQREWTPEGWRRVED